jgi:Rod binding domain-containing protein
MKPMPTNELNPQSGIDLKKLKLKKACEDFETIMTTYLLKSMHETVQRAETEEFGSGRDLYEGMMDEAVANQLSHTQGLGLAKMLYKQLASTLETRKASPDLTEAKRLLPQDIRIQSQLSDVADPEVAEPSSNHAWVGVAEKSPYH